MDAHEPRHQPPEWLELRELRYFLAVAEELNFTRAAERVHLAQQALSASIRNLEGDLGVQLFTRSTRHVALTAAGEARCRCAPRARERSRGDRGRHQGRSRPGRTVDHRVLDGGWIGAEGARHHSALQPTGSRRRRQARGVRFRRSEAGRGVAFTMPTVMANFPNTEIVTRPVADLEPGAVLLAWRRDDHDPVVAAFVRAARAAIAGSD